MFGSWEEQPQCGAAAVDPNVHNTLFPSSSEYAELDTQELDEAGRSAYGEADWKRCARASVASKDNNVFVLGGLLSDCNLNIPLSRVNILRVGREVKWASVKQAKGEPPTQRLAFSFTRVRDSLLLVGGCRTTKKQSIFSDVYRLHLRHPMEWKLVHTSGLAPVYSHIAVWVPGSPDKLLVHGGFTEFGRTTEPSNELRVLEIPSATGRAPAPADDDTQGRDVPLQWKSLSTSGCTAKLAGHQAVLMCENSVVLTVGGISVVDNKEVSKSNNVFVLYIPTLTWYCAHQVGKKPGARTAHQLVRVPRSETLAFLFGGYEHDTRSCQSQHVLQLVAHGSPPHSFTVVWEEVSSGVLRPPTGRSSHSMVTALDKIVVLGGRRDSEEFLGDVHVLDAKILRTVSLARAQKLQESQALVDDEAVRTSAREPDEVNGQREVRDCVTPAPPREAVSEAEDLEADKSTLPPPDKSETRPPRSSPVELRFESPDVAENAPVRQDVPRSKELGAKHVHYEPHAVPTRDPFRFPSQENDQKEDAESHSTSTRAFGELQQDNSELSGKQRGRGTRSRAAKRQRVERVEATRLASKKKQELIELILTIDPERRKAEDELRKCQERSLENQRDLTNELGRLRAEIVGLRTVNADLLKSKRSLEESPSTCQRIESSDEVNEELAKKLEHCEHQLVFQKEENLQLTNSTRVLEKDVSEARAEVAKCRGEVMDALEQKKDLLEQLKRKDQSRKLVDQSREEAEKKADEIGQQLAERDSQLRTLRRDLTKTAEELEDLKRRNTLLHDEREEALRRIAAIEGDLTVRRQYEKSQLDAQTRLREDYEALKNRLASLESELEQAKDRRIVAEQGARQALSCQQGLESRLATLTKNCQELEEDLEQARACAATSEEEVRRKEAQLSSKSARINEMEGEATRLHHALSTALEQGQKLDEASRGAQTMREALLRHIEAQLRPPQR